MSSEKAHHFRGEEHFQIWIKHYKRQTIFGGLTCMTTKIAMCANKINIVNFDFTRTLMYCYIVWFACFVYMYLHYALSSALSSDGKHCKSNSYY